MQPLPSPWVGLILGLAAYRLIHASGSTSTVVTVDGTCECGCGRATRIAPKTDRSKGWVKGRPLRFARGHNARVQNWKSYRELAETDYAVIDRGYETPCWIWRGRPTSPQGYCRVRIDGRYQAAHRAYYERFVGPIPEGHDAHHLCEQHSCVRPDHLEPRSAAEHRGMHKRKLTPEDVAEIRASAGVPLRDLAARFGVSRNYVCGVRTGLVRA